MAYNNILFNSIDIGALDGVSLETVQVQNRAKRNTIRKKLSRYDGTKVVRADYAEKEIIIEGVLSATTKATFETNRDRLFRYLDPTESTFRVSQAGANRDYIGTVDDVSWSEDPIGGMGRFVIRIVCSSPFGSDTSTTIAVNSAGNTTASVTKTFAPAIDGSAPALAIITITLASLTGGTSKYIKLTDPASSNYIQVTRTWTAADVLIVDASAKTCTVNGTSVDFSGNLLIMDIGSNQITYEDTLTTRNVTIKLEYKKRYR